jgi:hypothetical protein
MAFEAARAAAVLISAAITTGVIFAPFWTANLIKRTFEALSLIGLTAQIVSYKRMRNQKGGE